MCDTRNSRKRCGFLFYKTMSQKIDITQFIGKKYGMLSITEDMGWPKRDRMVIAICDCGSKKAYHFNNIITGKTKSCGCFNIKRAIETNTTHGLHDHRLYSVHRNMINRCYNPNVRHYKYYGGRGITVCDEWRYNFLSFYNWAIENGYQCDLKIERKNNDRGYEPDNCTWATDAEECRNKRSNIFIEFNGKRMCVADWSSELGVSRPSLYQG